MCRADGTPLQVVCHTTVIRNADGLPAQMVVHYIDVTALRQGEEDVRILNEELCVRIAELDQAKDRLAAAYLQVTAARESERRQLSVDLHDRPVQALLACLWSLDFLELEEDDEDLVKLREQLTGAIEETRQMIFELRPPALDMQGLPAAVDAELERLRTDTGVTTSLESDLDDRAPAEIETMVFRTLREALLNVRKHAKADTVVVRLAMREDMLWAQVVDDGVGFDPVKAAQRAAEGHYGVTSIRETLALAGGAVYVGPRRDGCRGTEVELTLPLVASAGWWGAVPEAALA